MITPLLFAEIGTTGLVIGGIGAILFFFFTMLAIWASRYTKVGPNQVLVVSGTQAPSCRTRTARSAKRLQHSQRRRRLRLPIFEKVDVLSLELLTIDVQTPEVYTSKGVPGEGRWRGANQDQRRRRLHRHRRRTGPEQNHRRNQERRHPNP